MISSGIYYMDVTIIHCWNMIRCKTLHPFTVSHKTSTDMKMCADGDFDQESEEIQSIVTVIDAMEESNDIMEPESHTELKNLQKAYADGVSMGQIELAKVIVRCIREKLTTLVKR
ncbi:hypothetical protein Hanom_Chr10g00896651 [Helianthus anomalus]